MEDFLNWELTNRMHNLGYDGKTLMYIDDEEDIINDDSAELIGAKPAILTSAAFRWFREKHDYAGFIQLVDPEYGGDYGYVIYYNLNYLAVDHWNKGFKTYEEAELACLDKLLEIVESKSE